MINSVVLMGRLTADPELRTTQSGISMCRFSVAVDRRVAAGTEKKADFINCTAWRQQADFISKYFHKGQMIAIEGSIQTGSYTDKQGNKRTSFDVIVDRASFCGSKNEGGNAPQGGYQQQPQSQSNSYRNSEPDDFADIAPTEDDLPF